MCRILYKFQAPMSQSTSLLYNYIFTTRYKNTPETSVRQLWANLCTWPRHAQKEPSQEGLYKGTQKEAEEWVGLQSQAKMCCSLGLTLRAGMLSNSQKEQKERRGKEEREGGRKRGGMRAEGICASLWETLLVLIYTSMTTAQNELTVRREQQQKARNKKIYGESY